VTTPSPVDRFLRHFQGLVHGGNVLVTEDPRGWVDYSFSLQPTASTSHTVNWSCRPGDDVRQNVERIIAQFEDTLKEVHGHVDN